MGIFYSIHRRDFSRKCSINLCQKSVFIIWITRKDYIGQKSKICGNILGSLLSRTKNLSSNINSISPPDRQLNKEIELDTKIVFTTLYKLHTEQLVSVITSYIVCIQCNTTERNEYVTI